MPRRNKIGYDLIETYTSGEVAQLYIAEGMDATKAYTMAKDVALTINNMATKERRLWKAIRDNEMIVGLDPEYLEDDRGII